MIGFLLPRAVRALPMQLFYLRAACSTSSTSSLTNDAPSELDLELEIQRPDLDTHQELLQEYQLVASGRQSVLVIQPYLRYFDDGKETFRDGLPEPRMAESLALVDSLGWLTAGALVMGAKSFKKMTFLGAGQIGVVKETLQSLQEKNVSAVFLSTYKMQTTQRIALETELKLPVLDRYNIILQIFHIHAKTREAKLQVALAEIPYLRARLNGDWAVENLNKHSLDRKGADFFERRTMMMNRRQMEIRRKIAKLSENRSRLRSHREHLKIPTIAVVGYTNCGKTSLIKALTGRSQLQPRNQLFATLDVTVHEMQLPCRLKVLFADTVGFISDIPTTLIASFAATLEDAARADVLLHVRDVSNPDAAQQEQNVLETLGALRMREELRRDMIVVGNKIDLLDASTWKEKFSDKSYLPISCKEGFGMEVLLGRLEKEIFRVTGRKSVVFRVRYGSDEYAWIRQKLTVSEETTDDQDENYARLKAVVTPQEMEVFKKQCGLRKNKTK